MADRVLMKITSPSVTTVFTLNAEKITRDDLDGIWGLLSGPDGRLRIIPQDVGIAPDPAPWHFVELGPIQTMDPAVTIEDALGSGGDIEMGSFIASLKAADAAGWPNVMGDLRMFLLDVRNLDPDDRDGLQALRVRAGAMVTRYG